MQSTVAAGAVRSVLELALRDGVSAAEIGRATRVTAASVADPEARVAFDRLLQLWAHLAKTLDDPSLPVRVAQRSTLEDLHVLGFAILTAPTLELALDTFARHSPLLTDAGTWEIARTPKRVEVRLMRGLPLTLGQRLSNESSLAQVTSAIRRLVGSDFEPIGVRFRHPAPPRVAAHAAFFRCRVEFDAPWDGLVLPRDLLDHDPPQANEALFGWLRAQVHARCAALAPRPLADTLRDRFTRALSDVTGDLPTATEIARALGMTDRTLRRRLRAERTSLRRVLEDVRRERAGAWIEEGRVSVTEIAQRLGFSDTSAFSHAYRRWFGHAPTADRPRGNALPA